MTKRCNQDCTQGRDCPARKFRSTFDDEPACVAKVGRRMHALEPLRGSMWRLYLKDLARSMLIVLAVMLVSAITVSILR
jgi:hypothetical protein